MALAFCLTIISNLSQPHFWKSVKMTLTLPKWGLGSPPRLPKLQSLIVGVKTPLLKAFFISLESYQIVDVENSLAWAIWTSAAQVMAKRGAGSQTGTIITSSILASAFSTSLWIAKSFVDFFHFKGFPSLLLKWTFFGWVFCPNTWSIHITWIRAVTWIKRWQFDFINFGLANFWFYIFNFKKSGT